MLRSLLRLLITSLYLTFRQNVTVHKVEDSYTYEQTYDVPTIYAQYKIRVTETIFIINYQWWFIPKIKRRLYKADLTYLIDGVVKSVFTSHYPRLSLWGGVKDPLYPLAVVASTHFENFLAEEQNL